MLVAGLLLLWLSSYLLRGFVAANPAVLSRRLRKSGGWLALGFAIFMMFRGEFNVAFGAALFGFWLLGTQPGWAGGFAGRAGGRWMPGGSRRQNRISRVRTASLDMTLDQTTGLISGRCLLGPMAGRSLDDLSQADGVALHLWCERADPQGGRLLETYLDRRFPAWRDAGQAGHDARRSRGSEVSPGMTEREAHQVLGLLEGANRDEITQAHRRMMKQYHPDHGGSTTMAARVNEAKDVLMRRHT